MAGTVGRKAPSLQRQGLWRKAGVGVERQPREDSSIDLSREASGWGRLRSIPRGQRQNCQLYRSLPG